MKQLFKLIKRNVRLEREMLLLKKPEIAMAYFLSRRSSTYSPKRVNYESNEALLLEDGMESVLDYWVKQGQKFLGKETEEKFRKQASTFLVSLYDTDGWTLSEEDKALLKGVVATATVEEMYDDIYRDECNEKEKGGFSGRMMALRWSKNASLISGYLKLGYRFYFDELWEVLEAGMEEARDVYVKKGYKFSGEDYAEFIKTAPPEIVDIHDGRAQVSKDEDLEFHEESLSSEDVALLRAIYDGTRRP